MVSLSYCILDFTIKNRKLNYIVERVKNMRWRDFLDRRQAYKRAWDGLKNEYTGDIRKFLNSSHMVITYGPSLEDQFDSKLKDAGSIAIDNPHFFIQDASGSKLIELARQYKELRDSKGDYKSKMKKQLEIMKELNELGAEFLNVVENHAEIRFPTLNIEFIQEVKKSRHCDKKMTNMGKDSIRVILKTDI